MSISLTACLLIAVLVRGVIPVGFMPAPLGAEAMSALTFCVNGLSNQNIAFLHLAQSSPMDDDSHPVHDCVFGAGHGKEYLPSLILPVMASALLLGLVLMPPHQRRQLCSRRFGPPLGARAPPVC
ncbi:hypothetical protein E4695_06685 [Alcaligenaceae bacterium 429]|uniref:hypothetical protein n=1 Tax=Paenalcaligenes sp. Me52 TaxID=3392038 RepID=UPI001092DB06|nr:hypothetical protein E4695_06685 [Alcaligenaceae bacterium 429]